MKEYIIQIITEIIIIGCIFSFFYFAFPMDTHCICKNGTTIFTHKLGMRNFEGYCLRFGDCKTFAGLDIDGQFNELNNSNKTKLNAK